MENPTWQQDEFGAAELGDERRTKRVVKMASRMLEHPAGKQTEVYEDLAELEAAYRLYENEDVPPAELERARGEACARRLARDGIAVVPIDQTSISLKEHRWTRKFGSVGRRTLGARGVQAMTALGLDLAGATLGVLGQEAWLRSEAASPCRRRGRGRRHDRRPAEARESFYWLRVLDMCELRLRQAPGVQVWYQADQGADFWRVFDWAHRHGVLLTARISHERVVIKRGHKSHLHPWIAGQPVAFGRRLVIPGRTGSGGRAARTARLSVRYAKTTFLFTAVENGKRKVPVPLTVVAATEPRPPPGVEPIDWLLLTTYPVATSEDAVRVIENYTLRWRCEEFHRALKTGACDIEASELESFEAFSRFLIVSSSVAARVEHNKFMSRTQPYAPATSCYSEEEIAVMLALRTLRVARQPLTLAPELIPLHLMTRWVATLGGYRYSRSRGPPGTLVLSRGMRILGIAVMGARAARGPPARCG
jgi:hypothetical protein